MEFRSGGYGRRGVAVSSKETQASPLEFAIPSSFPEKPTSVANKIRGFTK
jgi:hypothetical protein